MKQVAIIGAAGYTGGETLRLLLRHPNVGIAGALGRSHAGQPVYTAHADLVGETTLRFTDTVPDADVYMLCLPHGASATFVTEHAQLRNALVIDLAQDHRPRASGFVYGLPELQRDAIRGADRIANPGCFATAIQLAMLPALAAQVITGDVQVSATTGSTGAGRALSTTGHFTWRSANHSPYKALAHQHLNEIGETIALLAPDLTGDIHFIPQRGAFTRGICAVVHAATSWDTDSALAAYQAFYADHPFTHVAPGPVDLKQVVNTNKCLLHVEVVNGRLLVTSVIDNLLKGAAGQAVQNMNLALGFAETDGLLLKPIAY